VEVKLAQLAELSRAKGVDLTKLDPQTLRTIQHQFDLSEQAPNEATLSVFATLIANQEAFQRSKDQQEL